MEFNLNGILFGIPNVSNSEDFGDVGSLSWSCSSVVFNAFMLFNQLKISTHKHYPILNIADVAVSKVTMESMLKCPK